MPLSNLLPILLLLLHPLPQTLSFSIPNGESTTRVFVSTPAKPTIKIVADCMTSDPFTLSPDTPVDEAIVRLLAVGVSGAPVVEKLKSATDPTERAEQRERQPQLNLVGFVSSFDFLPREEIGSLVPLGDFGEFGEYDLGDGETARRILGQRVRDIMTRDPVTVTTNDLMKRAAEIMAKNRLHSLPVVDSKRGNLVGIITAKDVMRDVMKTASKALPSEEQYEQRVVEDESS